jgi:hypothetical protein
MQTVNFQCGHCGNLMAVDTEHLGQQVRCPHCEQVVVAPPPEPAPAAAAPAPGPAEPTFQPTALQNHEDIFAPPAPTEDLFDAPRLPKLEVPPPNGPAPEPAPAQPDSALSSSPPYIGDGEPTLPFVPANAQHPGEATLPLDHAPPGPNWMDQPTLANGPAPAAAPGEAAAAEAPAGEDLAAAIPRPARRPSGGGWFIPVIFIPLLVYAVLVTITAVIFWNRLQQTPPSPFDAMPDVDGDNPGVKKVKTGLRLDYDRKLTTDPLPPHLRVALGQALRVGDLEVTPTAVRRQRVAVVVEGFNGEPCRGDSLVLHLRLRNRAADYAFAPLDNYFDRCWLPQTGTPPLTLLEAGPHRFYGGPAAWRPRGGKDRREWAQGREAPGPDGLAPGKEQESFVCTDGNDPQAVLALFGEDLEGQRCQGPYKGPLLWRVQVRRGLYEWKGRRLPATAVIGVAFDSRDVAADG